MISLDSGVATPQCHYHKHCHANKSDKKASNHDLKEARYIVRSEQDIVNVINTYADTIKRLCTVRLQNSADTEDVFQTVFLKYALSTTEFKSEEHRKAWLIRVALNTCKDTAKSHARKRSIPLDAVADLPSATTAEQRDTLEAVLSLPQKYRDVVYLHYYEGYTAPEISKLIGKKTNTVYTLLTRSKKLLKNKLGGERNEA